MRSPDERVGTRTGRARPLWRDVSACGAGGSKPAPRPRLVLGIEFMSQTEFRIRHRGPQSDIPRLHRTETAPFPRSDIAEGSVATPYRTRLGPPFLSGSHCAKSQTVFLIRTMYFKLDRLVLRRQLLALPSRAVSSFNVTESSQADIPYGCTAATYPGD